MSDLKQPIIEFINNGKVASICFSYGNNEPYCITCFYSFCEKEKILIFKSSKGTKHDAFIIHKDFAAGTIISNQIDITKLRGLQFTGILLTEKELINLNLQNTYYKTNPMARLMPGYLWGVELNFIKFTDNTLGFGKKEIWTK
jgi:uncharacterized protein YhbP (UPF0306 family)